MFGRIACPLLLGLSLLAGAACGPASEVVQVDEPSASDQAGAARETSTDGVSESVSDSDEGASVVISTGESITGVQKLAWGADVENCIMPGIVITGSNDSQAPCDPLPEPEDAQTGNPETATEETSMTEETALTESAPSEPTQPESQGDYTATMTALAVEDLSQRLRIPVADIEVREVKAVTWPDASLGCPQPDMMYAQMLQDGLLIRLYANGEMYFYHSGGDQAPFLCEEILRPSPDARGSSELVPPPGSEIDKTD